jgi:hypothetical protein
MLTPWRNETVAAKLNNSSREVSQNFGAFTPLSNFIYLRKIAKSTVQFEFILFI